MLADAREFIAACNQMIYDYSYQHSLRFRFNHWMNIAKKQPEQFRSKLAIRLARPLVRHFPKSSLAHFVSKLESNLQLNQSKEKDSAHQF
jgi:hypothetical protein